MIFGKTKLELKVGVFVFIGLAILSIFVFSIGKVKTWTSGYRVGFIFNFVNGVKIGAPVRFAGVDVGEIKKIYFLPLDNNRTTRVRVVGWIKNNTSIPLDSSIWVNTLGLLGEKYIEIMPGKDYSKVLLPGEDIKGQNPMAMQEIGEMAKKIATDIDDVVVKVKNKEGTIGKLLYDDDIYIELDAFVKDIRKHPWKLFFKGKDKE